MLRNKKGFTLIELVLVIAILGVLAVTALPNIFNVSLDTARENSREAVVSSIQTALSLYAASQLSQGLDESYPADMSTNTGATSRENLLFDVVLQGGISRDWTKASATAYTYTGGGATDAYVYDPAEGTFLYTAP